MLVKASIKMFGWGEDEDEGGEGEDVGSAEDAESPVAGGVKQRTELQDALSPHRLYTPTAQLFSFTIAGDAQCARLSQVCLSPRPRVRAYNKRGAGRLSPDHNKEIDPPAALGLISAKTKERDVWVPARAYAPPMMVRMRANRTSDRRNFGFFASYCGSDWEVGGNVYSGCVEVNSLSLVLCLLKGRPISERDWYDSVVQAHNKKNKV
ncbi:hypothetical protein C8R47DRAFT_1195324 [Mycena vitilis]|nr:hypothetical protein C8R47DRAFT_1195324 [Mycena vitilis]